MQTKNVSRRLGLDTASYFTPFADGLMDLGFCGVMRYTRRFKRVDDNPNGSEDGDWRVYLSRKELDELIEKGWYVGTVQRAIRGQYDHSKDPYEQGAEAGEAASYNVKELKTPSGAVTFCDCEWKKPPSKADKIKFLHGFGKACSEPGHCVPGLYVSPDLGLTGDELYGLPYFKAYWKSASVVPTVSVRGPVITQTLEYFYHDGHISRWDSKFQRIKGLRFDANVFQVDSKQSWLKAFHK